MAEDLIGPAYENTDGAPATKVLAAIQHCAASWHGEARIIGNVRACDIFRAIDEVFAERLTPAPPPATAAESVGLREALHELCERLCAADYWAKNDFAKPDEEYAQEVERKHGGHVARSWLKARAALTAAGSASPHGEKEHG